MAEEVTDFELLERWGLGDHSSGAELLRRRGAELYGFFRNKAPDAVEDLMQQTLLACVEARARFRGESSFRTYLFQTARFQLYAHYRKRKRNPNLDFAVTSVTDLSPSPTAVLARKQDERILLEALRRVPLDHQIVLELSLWETLTGREIAEILEIPEPTVRSRMHRATERLRAEALALIGSDRTLRDTTDDLEAWAQRLRDALGRGGPGSSTQA